MLAVVDFFVVGNITCYVVGRCRFNIGDKIGFYASGFFLDIYDLYWATGLLSSACIVWMFSKS